MAKSEKIDWSVFASGAAGRKARLRALKEGSKFYIPALIFALTGMTLLLMSSKVIGLAWLITGLLLTWLIFRWFERKGDMASESWLKGARGEWSVAETLQEIESENFRVIHDLPNGSGNIDHFVVGRTGLFVIETKNWSGRIHYTDGTLSCNGRPLHKDPVKQVKKQAVYLSKKIEGILGRRLWVEPILCFVCTSIEPNASTVKDVNLTNPQSLRRLVTKGKAVLSQAEVEQIRMAAEGWR